MTTTKTIRIAIAAALLVGAGQAAAQFSAVVTPPRFETSSRPGGRVMEVVAITNTAPQQAVYKTSTADWTLAPDGGVHFKEELQPGSCRPWVAIEAREIVAAPGRRTPFRVQVEIPEDASPQECRFAVLFEGQEQIVQSPGGPGVPVSGRIAVIFYVSVGQVAPKLDVAPAGVRKTADGIIPALKVKNEGAAHGRLSGFLSGVDAKGQRIDFTPSTLPILPGEVRVIDLAPTTPRGEVAVVAYPVTVEGRLEWGRESAQFRNTYELPSRK